MFGWRRRGTIIGKGLRVVGKVTADGLVKVYGQVDGELQCARLIVARNAQVSGAIKAGKVVVEGKVEGPIEGGDVVLKSRSHVVGDIPHQSLGIEKGAHFEGRSVQTHQGNERQPDKAGKKPPRRVSGTLEAIPAAEPVG
jgi:cytoskeletal protein CcmA (bactofilin family)